MKNKPKFRYYRANDGWRWRLVAGNGKIVATGESHKRKTDAVRASLRVAEIASSVPINDQL